ncbi:MAG: hypothetical protein LBI94_02355, partial [Treponema sp.]|nr:hypothetical protein [Treponema sp.]
MKFKFFFLFFNAVVAVFLLIILFMPVMILGDDLFAFWGRNFRVSLWSLAAILVIALIMLDIYYFINRKLFRLLEREDWPALSAYLETLILRKGRYSGRLVRLFANTCLVLSDSQAVIDLENKLALVKPALVERNALIFGAARILAGDYGGALRFFAARDRGIGGNSPFLSLLGGGRSKQWLAWYHGFSLLLEKQFMEAAEKFRFLAREARNPVAAALAAWFLAENLSRTAGNSFLEDACTARERIRGILRRRKDWDREVARTETDVHTAILRKYI